MSKGKPSNNEAMTPEFMGLQLIFWAMQRDIYYAKYYQGVGEGGGWKWLLRSIRRRTFF